MNEKKVIRQNKDGKEMLTLLDENDVDTGFSITMESVFEAREMEELDATTILSSAEKEALTEAPKPSTRLELNNVLLIHKDTGEILKSRGALLSAEERAEKNITGMWLNASDGAGMEHLIIVPFKIDGTIPDLFPYIVEEEKT